MLVTAALIELNLADIEDLAARSQAMRSGLSATQPLTTVRLRELCELGEKMMRAERRKHAAMLRASKLFAS
jgi:hypothetical protein